MTEEWRGAKSNAARFVGLVRGTKFTNLKAVLGSRPGEYVGFRNKFFPVMFNDTY
jgi:hypothetical protein